MRTPVLFLLISLLSCKLATAHVLEDSITYGKLLFYNHSLVHNGKHLNLKKVAKSYSNDKAVQVLYHQIRRRRWLMYAVSGPAGGLFGFGVTYVILTGRLDTFATPFVLVGGGLMFLVFQCDLQEQQDMQRLANILP